MNVVLFGTGYCFSKVFSIINSLDRIIGVIDNDKNKQGCLVSEMRISPVKDVIKYKYDLIVLCAEDCDDMRDQLVSLGVINDKICTYLHYFLNKGRKYNTEDFGIEIDRFFDIDFFRNRNVELQTLSDAELIDYYFQYGEKNGSIGAEVGYREGLQRKIKAFLNKGGHLLEIGPFDNPMFVGENVKYFDIYDSDRLKKEARERGRNNNRVPENINYVSAEGDLSIIKDKFDIVFSAHNIEHQPNFIGHIRQIERILKSNGYYAMIIPDKRYSFDYYAPISTVSKIIDDYENEKKINSLSDCLNMGFFRTHNDALAHWKGKHGALFGMRNYMLEDSAYVSIDGKKYFDDNSFDLGKVHELIAQYKNAKMKDIYIDAHCNRFTPNSFRYIITMLKELGYINMKLLCVHNTPYGKQEFCAIMKND